MVNRQLGRALLLAGALGLASAVACGKPAETPTPVPKPTATIKGRMEQAGQFYSPLSEVPVLFLSEKLEGLYLSEDLIMGVRGALPKVYADAVAHGFPTLPDGVSALTVKLVRTGYSQPQSESLEGKILTAQRSVEHMRAYLSEAAVKWPRVDFVVADSSSEVESALVPKESGSHIDAISVYPVGGFEKVVFAEGSLRYGKRIVPFTISVDMSATLSGGINEMVDLNPTNSGFVTTFSYGNILWRLDVHPQTVLETPPLEVLHAALYEITSKHISKGLDGLKTVEEARATVSHYIRLYIRLEEYIVHGIGRDWFRKLNEDWRLGYDAANLGKSPSVTDWWRDENVGRVAELVRQKGPAAVVEMYRTSPQLLMAEAGIVIK